MKDAKIEFFSNYVLGKKVLDVGVVQHTKEAVDHETWLHRAICQSASNAVGLDIDADGAERLKALGYDVRVEDAQDFNLGSQFDVVAAGDLIEHLENPGDFLRCAKNHLSKDGILLLTTPNPFWWKTYLHVLLKGHASPHPEHTCWFCEKTITQLLTRAGFTVTSTKYRSVYILNTVVQRITRFLTNTIFLMAPARLKHNTIMIVASKR